MAKVIMPLMSDEARGKMSGLIYNTWRGISTVKSFTSPANPKTSAQMTARARLQSFTAGWKNLTQAQRDAWNTYAETHLKLDWTGKPKRITGQNWYISCNIIIAICGGTAITDPPASAAPEACGALTVAYVAGSPKKVTVDFTDPATVQTNNRYIVYSQNAISAGRKGSKTLARIASVLATDPAGVPAEIINPAVAGKYYLWVGVADKTTGLVSAYQSGSAVVS